jgi:hypothetical protein
VAGILAWDNGLIPGKPIHNLTEQKVYDKVITSLDLRVDSGDVEIRAGEEGQVAIERRFKWTSDKPIFTENWDGTQLNITSKCPGEQLNCSLGHTISVPANTVILVQTDAGNVSVTGLLKDIHLTTVAGNVHVGDAQGRLEIKTTDGEMDATNLKSAYVNTETTSGDITLQFASAPLEVMAKVGAGNITIGVPRNKTYAVSAKTTDGQRDVSVQQDSTSPHAIKIQAGAGDVVVQPVE